MSGFKFYSEPNVVLALFTDIHGHQYFGNENDPELYFFMLLTV